MRPKKLRIGYWFSLLRYKKNYREYVIRIRIANESMWFWMYDWCICYHQEGHLATGSFIKAKVGSELIAEWQKSRVSCHREGKILTGIQTGSALPWITFSLYAWVTSSALVGFRIILILVYVLVLSLNIREVWQIHFALNLFAQMVI